MSLDAKTLASRNLPRGRCHLLFRVSVN